MGSGPFVPLTLLAYSISSTFPNSFSLFFSVCPLTNVLVLIFPVL